MTGDLLDLARELRELADAPAPPARIDLAGARRTGQRRRQLRAAGVVTGVVALVLSAGLAVTAVRGPAGGPEPATGAPPAVTGTLVVHATFGWLPDSVDHTEFAAGTYGDYVHARAANNGTNLWLTTYPAEPALAQFSGGAKQIAIPAPPVNGRPARWITSAAADPLNGGDAYLRWQAPGGKWAELHGYYLVYLQSPDPQAVLHRIAAGVTVADQAVPLPVRMGTVPAQFMLTGVSFFRPMLPDNGSGAWFVQLTYGSAFTVEVSPHASVTTWKITPVCKTADGLDVCVLTESTDPLGPLGGPQGILARATPLGTNEANWTTTAAGG